MSYRWKPSAAARREYGESMNKIENFCRENGITQSLSGDSYYFRIAGVDYRVSNHTIEASNRGAFNWNGEQSRELYHENGREKNTVYITAGKTRIISIYNDLIAGYQLDKRGKRI